ncbi:MAG TPA: bifunctional diaminohydroxyphosphoribosylaminopyrimidine deaminase/5-amino-6-(5-phosphoribosylamino)uracil reductase RibD [Tepidiformaceae bacterium]|nr:bifunctional diaminohydroxyphosphoribosylaminopyrimidine deaminase/5-amino-6-(5-phosphoribosylamino)uracil reductase RibD [Tepidiformaceae bacterium]
MSRASTFMGRALEAAHAVRGYTSPNPWVGAVAVRDDLIVALGATSPPGGPHAEATALAAATGPVDTLYVTLEPCAPFAGKRTPPCSDAIIDSGVRRVVVALEDPDPHMRGRGIERMREAGIDVVVGDGMEEAVTLLRPYLKHRQAGLPYVIAKWAATLDGRTASASGDSKWITGEPARERVHLERAWVDAILVGSATVLADDPALTARPGGELSPHQPVRIILDGRGRTPPTARLFGGPGHVIIATSREADTAWKTAVVAAGAQVIECERDGAGVNLEQLLPALGARGIMSLWVEGGSTVLGSFFDGGHVDEVWAFVAPLILGSGIPAVGGLGAASISDATRLEDHMIEQVGDDILVRGYTGGWSPYN